MAFVEPFKFSSKKGKQITIRCVEVSEAQKLRSAMIEIAEYSPFILSTADDFRRMTIEQEEKFISSHNEPERNLLLIAEHGDNFVGILNFTANRKKANHRGYLAISLRQEFRGEGIAKKLFEVLIQFAKMLPGLKYIELDMIHLNKEAFELYKKVGFELVHVLPEALQLPSGSFADNYFMRMKI